MPLPLAELMEFTPEEVAGYLADRLKYVKTAGLTIEEKQANAVSDALSALGRFVAERPIVGKALLGSGIGALAGGATHLIGGNEYDPKAKRRGILSSALTGGLAGAAIGGGVGAIQHFGGSGGTPAPTTPTNEFVHRGQRYRLSPETLRANPEIADRIRELTSGSSGPVGWVGNTADWIWNNPHAPWSGKILSVAAPLDIALSARNRRLNDLQTGLRTMLKGDEFALGPNRPAFERLANNEAAMRTVLRGQPGRINRVRQLLPSWLGGVTPPETGGTAYAPPGLFQQEQAELIRPRGQRGGPRYTNLTITDPAGNPIPQAISRDTVAEALRTGRNARTSRSIASRFGMRRLAAYLGLPIAEMFASNHFGNVGRTANLEEIIRRYGEPRGPVPMPQDQPAWIQRMLGPELLRQQQR
jgi:hypothetical protein